MLWSDPEKEIAGWGENDRGVSFTFGQDVVHNFLRKHDLDLICRAHQVPIYTNKSTRGSRAVHQVYAHTTRGVYMHTLHEVYVHLKARCRCMGCFRLRQLASRGDCRCLWRLHITFGFCCIHAYLSVCSFACSLACLLVVCFSKCVMSGCLVVVVLVGGCMFIL